MSTTKKLMLFIWLSILLIGCGSPSETTSRADTFLSDPVAVQRGRSIFVGTCAGYCHKLSPEPSDAVYLFDCEWKHGGSDQQIFNTVTNGVPNTRMIAFGSNFPEGEDDLWKVIAFLKSNRTACS
jgi:mono/diheme cytochrome c family protein